jgi:hypothetical protein
MPRDSRLDLDQYFGDEFNRRTKLDFDDLFRSSVTSDQYPWTPNRFTADKLLTYAESRKRNLNKRLNTVDPNDPQNFELFDGLGRFNKDESYDFNTGVAKTKHKPEEQINYNPTWMELYRLSPTIKPGDRIKNPMPSATNPDPYGYLLSTVQNQINKEEEGVVSISELVSNSSTPPTQKEEEQGEEEIKKAEEEEPAPVNT